MSVDLAGTLSAPLSFAALVTAARETLTLLTGVDEPPVLEVVVGRRYADGELVDAGRRMSADELTSTMLAPHADRVDIETPAGDGARLTVSAGSELSAVFTPDRTCTGVVIATALALAAARDGGEFVDINIFMLLPPQNDPERVIELTRLPDRGHDFGARCEQYLRQFAHLEGWPAS